MPVACSSEPAAPEAPDAIRLEVTFDTTAIAIADGATVAAIAEGAGRTVAATSAGLYSLAGDTLERVTERPARAVAHVEGVGFVFATDETVETWDGVFVRPSKLEIEPRGIRAFAARGADLFVLRDSELLVASGGRITALGDVGDASSLSVSPSGLVVVGRAQGGVAFEHRDGSWQRLELEEDLSSLGATRDGRVVGIRGTDRSLVERVAKEGRVSFREVAPSVDAVVTDAANGATWIVTPATLEVMRDGVVSSGARPVELAPGGAAWAVAGTSLFASNGTGLVRVRAEAARISWNEAVRPIYQRHCERCHRAGGTARFPLATAADWRAGADAILAAIEDGRMPRDRETTVSLAELDIVRQWRATGAAD